MEEFRIVLSQEELLIFEEPSVELDAGLYVQVGEVCLPDSLWTDHALFTFSMWSEAFLRHGALTRQTYALPFSDGPFEIQVVQEDGRMTLRGSDFHKERREVFCCTVSTEQFCRELLRTWDRLRRIAWFCDSFQKPGSKQAVLEIIDHYREKLGDFFS